MRAPASHRMGAIPVSAANRRANVRGAQPACRASTATVSGSARCSSAQSQVGARPSPGGGTGRSIHWAWPPSRCGATTSRRATLTAASLP